MVVLSIQEILRLSIKTDLLDRTVNGNPIIYYNGIISEEEKYDEDGFKEEITMLKEDIAKLLKE